jgi:hypothetical protein
MLRIILVVLLLVSSALAISEEDLLAIEEGYVDTDSGTSTSSSSDITLNWGDSISVAPYEIRAVGFSEGTVEEKKDKCSSAKEYEKRLLGCMDYVLLKVARGDKNVLDAVLSDHNITVEGIELTNSSTFEDEDFLLTLFARNVVTGYNIPSPYVDLTITLKQKEKSENLDNNPPVSLLKTVPEWAYLAYRDEEDYIYISLEVENLVNTKIQDIRLHDSIPDGFAVASRGELNWTIDLGPKEKWQTGYFLKQTNSTDELYIFTPATLNVTYRGRLYNIQSSESTMHLYGSMIVMNKSVNGRAKEYSVAVNVENRGNRASRVDVTDMLPENATLVNGTLNFTVVLQPGKEYTNSYIINIINNNTSLPQASAKFYDYNPSGESSFRSGTVHSHELDISEAAYPEPASTAYDIIPTPAEPHISNNNILINIINFFKSILRLD